MDQSRLIFRNSFCNKEGTSNLQWRQPPFMRFKAEEEEPWKTGFMCRTASPLYIHTHPTTTFDRFKGNH